MASTPSSLAGTIVPGGIPTSGSDYIFPALPGISMDIKTTAQFSTVVQTGPDRGEARVSLDPFPLWQFEISFGYIRDYLEAAEAGISPETGYTQLQQIVALFCACSGKLKSFLLSPSIITKRSNEGVVTAGTIGTGDGATLDFQTIRTVGAYYDEVQNVTPGTMHVFLNGVETTAFSLSSSGVIQFLTPPAIGVLITASFEWMYRVRFVEDEEEFDQFLFQIYQRNSLKLLQVRVEDAYDDYSTTPLDVIPGGVGCYSTRLLLSGYTGPLLRARRASDGAVQDIYPDATGAADSVALANFAGAIGGSALSLVTLYDQTQTAGDATQATTANQPGLSTIALASFDGATGFLAAADNAALDFAGDFSLVAMVKTAAAGSSGSARDLFSKSTSGGTGYECSIPASATTAAGFINNGSASVTAAGGLLTDANWHRVILIRAGTVVTLWIDGIQVATATLTAGAVGSSAALTIGAEAGGSASFFAGNISTVIAFGRALSAPDIEALQTTTL